MASRDLAVRETVNARQERFGPEDLAQLFKGASSVVVAKGKKTLTFDPKKELEAISEVAIGRSGNLRAPTLKVGKRYLVGFSAEVWESFFD